MTEQDRNEQSNLLNRPISGTSILYLPKNFWTQGQILHFLSGYSLSSECSKTSRLD